MWHADKHDGTRVFIFGSDLSSLKTGAHSIRTLVSCVNEDLNFYDISCSTTPNKPGIPIAQAACVSSTTIPSTTTSSQTSSTTTQTTTSTTRATTTTTASTTTTTPTTTSSSSTIKTTSSSMTSSSTSSSSTSMPISSTTSSSTTSPATSSTSSSSTSIPTSSTTSSFITSTTTSPATSSTSSTTQPTPTSTSNSLTTSEPQQCQPLASIFESQWDVEGQHRFKSTTQLIFNGQLVGDTWYVDFDFSVPVTSLEVYKGNPAKLDNFGYKWRMTGVAGAIIAADDTEMVFIADIATSQVPEIDLKLCLSGPAATSTTQSTTSSSTSTASTAATTTSTVTTTTTLPVVPMCQKFEHPGDMTVYKEEHIDSVGNCDLPVQFINEKTKAATHFAAITTGLFNAYDNSMSCGRCVRIKCSCEQSQFDFACEDTMGNEVYAMIVDSCPSCQTLWGDIDLSGPAWRELTGNQGGSRFDGSYEFVPCPDEFIDPSGTKLRFKEGSNMFWTAVQVFNHRHKIEKVEYKRASDFTYQLADKPLENSNTINSFYFMVNMEAAGTEICATNEMNVRSCVNFSSQQITELQNEPGNTNLNPNVYFDFDGPL